VQSLTTAIKLSEGTAVSLFSPGPFAGFGNNRLNPFATPANGSRIQGKRSSQLKARLSEECPRSPGVYGMVNRNGELIYVGKSKSLRARLLSYFRPRSRDPKAGCILRETCEILWEYTPSEFAALLRELELIRRWQPEFNVAGQPRRFRRTYVCLGRRPAPHVFLARRPPRGVRFWGPVFANHWSREAVRRLNDWFGLRDCPQPQEMIFAEQREMFPVERTAGCIRHEIGTCLAPCAAFCTREAYDNRVRAAAAFLDGGGLAPLEQIERQMVEASKSQAFERAAALRDRLVAMQWMHKHLDRIRQARTRNHFIYPVKGHNGQDVWYLIRQGWVAAAVPLPNDEASRQRAASAIMAVYHQPRDWHGPAWSEEIDGVLLVSAWFGRHPRQQKRTLTPADALAAVGHS
jgi:excinuclease ABC subunit C